MGSHVKRMERTPPHQHHVHIQAENSLLFQDITWYCMVIKVLPLLCAQAGLESQVTFDGPMLYGSWSLLPTESVKLLMDQIVSCSHFHTFLWKYADRISEDFRTGLGDKTQLSVLQIYNTVVLGALRRALVMPSTWKGQERTTKYLRRWSGSSIHICQPWSEGSVRRLCEIWSKAWTMQLLAIYVTLDWYSEMLALWCIFHIESKWMLNWKYIFFFFCPSRNQSYRKPLE